jgi:hypothetical protein
MSLEPEPNGKCNGRTDRGTGVINSICPGPYFIAGHNKKMVNWEEETVFILHDLVSDMSFWPSSDGSLDY